MKPLVVDLCAGLGGWTEGFLAEGWNAVGFDIERHQYGKVRYPGQLVVQDILTLDGRQFRGKVNLIVASPPCQKYSYMAMPWTRAKALADWYRDPAHPERIEDLNRLFNACFRIAREAECPIVLENVRGAQPWVGRARWMYGSFALWGDVPALMPITMKRVLKIPSGTGVRTEQGRSAALANYDQPRSGLTKNDGGSWFNIAHNTTSGHGQNPDGRKAPADTQWFNDGPRTPDSLASMGSKSSARKAASAHIAKIPFPLACHIAKSWKPEAAPPVVKGE